MRSTDIQGYGGAIGIPIPHPLEWLKDKLGRSR